MESSFYTLFHQVPAEAGADPKKNGGSAKRQGLYMLQQRWRFSAVIFGRLQMLLPPKISYTPSSWHYEKTSLKTACRISNYKKSYSPLNFTIFALSVRSD